MTLLREQRTQDRVLRGLASNTQRADLQTVTRLAQYYDRSPDRVSKREVKAYLLHLHQDEKRATSTCNVAAAALRFLDYQTLSRSRTDFEIPIARKPTKLPHVLSRDEVVRLVARTHFLKHRVLFLVASSAGLRVREIVKLRPRDIDAGRMGIRVEQGKGAKDRLTLLSPRLLEGLRDSWRRSRPGELLFPSGDGKGHLCTGGLKHAFFAAKLRAKIDKPGGIHLITFEGPPGASQQFGFDLDLTGPLDLEQPIQIVNDAFATVPEPSTLVLVLGGLAALAARRREHPL